MAWNDFPAQGTITYRPLSIIGKETDPDQVRHGLAAIAETIALASASRHRSRKEITGKNMSRDGDPCPGSRALI